MNIQPISNYYNPSAKGLYFADKYPLFNPRSNYTKSYLKGKELLFSENGYRYVENKEISQELKEKLSNIPFIKYLSEKYDTFIINKIIRNTNPFDSNRLVSSTEVIWAKPKKKYPQSVTATGFSDLNGVYFDGVFEEFYANENMLNKLGNFKIKENKNYRFFKIN